MKMNEYIFGDAMQAMGEIPDNVADLVFTSMPDLSQTPNDKSENGIKEYRKFQSSAIDEMARIVKPDGFVVICQTDRKVNGRVLSNHMWYSRCLEDNGLHLKDYKIVIRNEIGKKDLYHFTFQHMICYTAQGKFKRKGDFIRDIIIDKQKMIGNQSVWSQDFCELVIENLTDTGDLVVDPFAGVAPVLYAAKNLDRNYWGAEIAEEFYNKDFEWFQSTLPV